MTYPNDFYRDENVKLTDFAKDSEMGPGQRVAMLAIAGFTIAAAGGTAIKLCDYLSCRL